MYVAPHPIAYSAQAISNFMERKIKRFAMKHHRKK
jgi:hypothetical protein